MQKKARLLIIFAHFLFFSCAKSKDFVLYQKEGIKPVIYYQGSTKGCADDFIGLFKKLGGTLNTTNVAPPTDKVYIKLEINPQITGFTLVQDNKQLTISGSTENTLKKGIRYFFSQYTHLNQFNLHLKDIAEQQTINIPLALHYASNSELNYIEPYFAENFSQEFRLWNNTNTLEETWGLWGHNIGKFIKVTPEMYAIVDGKPNEEQLNFSSKALQDALEKAIANRLENNPQANKFMVMPYDNELVCQCEQCIKEGNTKTNASPAVYALIDKLADEFPNAFFYSTAYVSTETPPKKSVRENVGVMISTMSFPKGVVLENSNKAPQIAQKFKDWQKITKNIYLWDYAINFDNYFEFYPTVAIAQKNLQFYLKSGVTGIFMHGSDEGSFAAFGDLKCYLYAQLFNNPNTDLKYHTQLFLENNYPTLGKMLSEYYIKAEETALQNNRTIDIYGGIKQAVKKYLKQEELNKYLNVFLQKKDTFNPKERKASEMILMAFIFQNLELLRTNGVAENGYANYQDNQAILKPEVQQWLTLLKQLANSNGIDRYNESNLSLKEYISLWDKRIIQKPYQNLFYKKPFKVVSKLDEDYSDSKMLNDGAIGFNDYYNNWLINSAPMLTLETNVAGMKNASSIQIDFLHDKKHKIYPPEKITAYIGERKYESTVAIKTDSNLDIVHVNIPIKINANDNSLRIEIKKQVQSEKKLMACDEIIFK